MSAETPPTFPPDTMLGRYKIVRRLGIGGMGEVYEALHTDLNKRVAIKTLLPAVVAKPDIVGRFLREGRAAARLRHPHAVDVFDVLVHEGTPFLVMELLEGQDLADLLRTEVTLSTDRIASIMLPVLAALGAAHRDKIVHRDLKPANIFLHTNRDGVLQPKVVDFGISKMADAEGAALTGTAALLGTPHYMSPEQVRSTRDVGPIGDVYSLGVVLYECATGQTPFHGETVFMILQAIVQGPVTPPREINPKIPVAFEQVILRAMARDPAQRFASVAELGRELIAFADPRTLSLWEPVFGSPSCITWTPQPSADSKPSAASLASSEISRGTITGSSLEIPRRPAISETTLAMPSAPRPRSRIILSFAHLGSLEVQCDTPNAEVWINNQRIGPVGSALRVLAGTASFEVRARGFTTTSRVATVAADGFARERVALARSMSPPQPITPQPVVTQPVVTQPVVTQPVVTPLHTPQTAPTILPAPTNLSALPRPRVSVQPARSSLAPSFGIAAVVVGGAALVGGVVSFALGLGQVSAYNDDPNCLGIDSPVQSTDCASRISTGQTLESLAWTSALVGTVFVTAGVVLLATSGHSLRERMARSAFICGAGPGTLGASCGLRF